MDKIIQARKLSVEDNMEARHQLPIGVKVQ